MKSQVIHTTVCVVMISGEAAGEIWNHYSWEWKDFVGTTRGFVVPTEVKFLTTTERYCCLILCYAYSKILVRILSCCAWSFWVRHAEINNDRASLIYIRLGARCNITPLFNLRFPLVF